MASESSKDTPLASAYGQTEMEHVVELVGSRPGASLPTPNDAERVSDESDMESTDNDDLLDKDYCPSPPMDEIGMMIYETDSEDDAFDLQPTTLQSKNVTKSIRTIEDVDISSRYSNLLKRGAAFDSDTESEPEDEYEGLKKEYATFVSTKFRSDDVWDWLKVNKKNFPRIHAICMRLLVIPAASASSERLFSRAGNVITAKRSALLPDSASDSIFLASNSKLIQEFFP